MYRKLNVRKWNSCCNSTVICHYSTDKLDEKVITRKVHNLTCIDQRKLTVLEREIKMFSEVPRIGDLNTGLVQLTIGIVFERHINVTVVLDLVFLFKDFG